MHFNILIKFPINSYLSKARNLCGGKKNRQKSYVILDSWKWKWHRLYSGEIETNKNSFSLSLSNELFCCLEYGIVEKKEQLKEIYGCQTLAHISRVYSNEKSERVKLICNVRFLLKPFFLETKLNINTVKHSNLLLLLLRHARNTFHNFTRYFCYFVEFSVFSFCFCEIFICNFEYRSMLFR